MKKTYYAKFLPVDEEIKEGDYYFTIRTDYTAGPHKCDKITENEVMYYSEGNINHTIYTEKEFAFKAKMFLCSRDVQVGDKVIKYTGNCDKNTGIVVKIDDQFHIRLDNFNYDEYQESISSHNYTEKYIFKVIGEISPAAIWVSDGDEFDEHEFTEYWTHWVMADVIQSVIQKV